MHDIRRAPCARPALLRVLGLLLPLLSGTAAGQTLPGGNWAVSVTTDAATYLLTLQVSSSDGEVYTLVDSDNTEASVDQLSLVEGVLSFDTQLLAKPFHCMLSKDKPGLYEGSCSQLDEAGSAPVHMTLEIPENSAPPAADTPATVETEEAQ